MFNDTYGSGQQFLDTVWPFIQALPSIPRRLFVVGVAIAKEALAKFSALPGVCVIPDAASNTARELFSESDLNNIRELGRRVYPKHPLGFGDAAMMVAYYFQCPNNTIPLIWADGENNKVEGRRNYPWFPLFPYRPKIRNNLTLLFEEQSTTEESPISERERMLREIKNLRESL